MDENHDPRCPQLRDGEPTRSGRHCPLDVDDSDDSWLDDDGAWCDRCEWNCGGTACDAPRRPPIKDGPAINLARYAGSYGGYTTEPPKKRIDPWPLALLVACLLAGCDADAVSTAPTDNAQIKVERLFDHDGCTVYRFRDGGTRYFVKCRDGSTRTEWSESYPCGKSMCRREVAVPGA